MEITATEEERFELVNTVHIVTVLEQFMSSNDSDRYLEELYYVSRSDPKFREILLDTFNNASLGDLSELDLAGFKNKLRYVLSNRYTSQELTFLIALVLFISLITYAFSPIPDTEELFGSKIISSAMFANLLAAFITQYRKGVIEKRAMVCAEDITKAMRILNRTRYYQKYNPDYGEA